MPDLPHPVSAVDLIRLGLNEAAAEAAAQEIAELVYAIFSPFDTVAEDVWAVVKAQDPDAATMRRILGDAAEAEDPLTVVAGHREAWAMLERHLRPRWSSPGRRRLGHPPELQGQTWASLSETAREEVREALRHLRGFWASRVRRNRPKREDLDTFLRELAEIFVVHSREGDRASRARSPLWHRTDVPHSATSRFIQLGELVLEHLPPLPTGEHRIAIGERTARGLSERWERIKAHEATGWDESDEADEGSTPP